MHVRVWKFRPHNGGSPLLPAGGFDFENPKGDALENPISVPATGRDGFASDVNDVPLDGHNSTNNGPAGQDLASPAPKSKAHKIAEALGVPLPRLFHGRTARQCDLLLKHFRYEEESEGHRCSLADIFLQVALAPTMEGPASKYKTSIGAMWWNAKEQKASQDRHEAKGIETTPRGLVQWARAQVGVGPKAQAKVIYPAYLEIRGDTHKSNALLGQCLIFDHDAGKCPVRDICVASLDTEEHKAAWLSWLGDQGMHFSFTTSSHKAPWKGGHNSMSAILWLQYALPAPLLAFVGAKAREEAAKIIETDLSEPDWDGVSWTTDKNGKPLKHRMKTRAKCLDEITSRPVQARYTVKHESPELAKFYEDRFAEDLLVKDPTRWLDLVVADLEAQADLEEEQAKMKARRQKYLELRPTDIDVGTSLTPRLDWAQKKIDEHGQSSSGNGGNDHAFFACLIGWRAGLQADEFWPILQRWNHANSPPWTDSQMYARLQRSYRTASIPFGCAFSAPELSTEELIGVPLDQVDVKEDLFTEPTPTPKEEFGEEFRSEYKGKLGVRWTKICKRYLPQPKSFADFEESTIFIRSHYGTGKNFSLAAAIREVAMSPEVAALEDAHLAGEGITVYNSRRSLVRSSAGSWGLPTHLDAEGEAIVGNIVACVHSAQRVVAGNKILLFDDSESIAQSILHGPLRTKGLTPHILNALKAQVSKAYRTLYADAELGAPTICLARLLNGTLRLEDKYRRSEHHITNTWRPPSEEFHVWKDYDGWIEELCRVLEDPEKNPNVWAAFTSKNQLLIVEKLLQKRFPGIDILAVHQDSCHRKDVRAALDNPSLFKNYRLVMASPTAGTGVSVIDLNTWKTFGCAVSGSGPTAKDFGQQVHRPRHPIGAIQVCLIGYAPSQCSDLSALIDRRNRNNDATLADLARLGTTWDTRLHADGTVTILPDDDDLVFLDAVCEADRNKWGGTFGNLIRRDKETGEVVEIIEGSYIRLLEEQGARVVLVGAIAADPKAAKVERKEVSKDVKVERKKLMRTLPPMRLEDAQKAVLAPEPPEYASLILAAAQHRDFFDLDWDDEIDGDQLDRDTPHYRKGVRHVEMVEARYAGYEQEIRAQDKRATLEDGHTCHWRHDGLLVDFYFEVLNDFGIKRGLEKDALSGAVIAAPPESWLTKELCRKANDLLGSGARWHPKMGVQRAFRSIMDRLCLATDTTSFRDQGNLVRERRLRLAKVDQILKDGKGFKRKLLPKRTIQEEFADAIASGELVLLGT